MYGELESGSAPIPDTSTSRATPAAAASRATFSAPSTCTASNVTEGSSVTAIEFRLEVNQDRALNDVKDAIDAGALVVPG